jgi:glycosyltransferase involved in cell wall biosynthesis
MDRLDSLGPLVTRWTTPTEVPMEPEDASRTTLLVVAPVFNEEEVLPRFVAEVLDTFDDIAHSYDARLLLVVDPGTDRTEDRVRELVATSDRVCALFMSRRVGHQASLLAGLDYCFDDVCITMDADLQHPPSLIPELLKLHVAGVDIVQTIRLDTEDASLWKRTSSKAFYRFLNRISEVELVESGADFRLMSQRVVEIFRSSLRERNPFIRGMVQWVGFPTATLPFRAPSRGAGHSKYSSARSIAFGISGVVSFSKTPLRLGIVIGGCVAGLAFLAAAYSVIAYFSSSSLPPGWATLSVLIALLAAVQLLTIGVIGIYVGAIFDEVKGRPTYIIREHLTRGTK